MNELKYAQDVLKYPGGDASAGFNRRVLGETRVNACGYPNPPSLELNAGWQLADDMINDGKLFYVHNFHHSHNKIGCNGIAFIYGATWVCNSCGRDDVEREWWKIKVMKDGSAWCCIGTGFENLQESDNYAFGDTREEAINNYGDLMLRGEPS